MLAANGYPGKVTSSRVGDDHDGRAGSARDLDHLIPGPRASRRASGPGVELGRALVMLAAGLAGAGVF